MASATNRRGTQRPALFSRCPWDLEEKTDVFCYECHEGLIHNVVFLPDDIRKLRELIRLRRLSEDRKTESRKKIAGRIELLHEMIATGIDRLLEEVKRQNAREVI